MRLYGSDIRAYGTRVKLSNLGYKASDIHVGSMSKGLWFITGPRQQQLYPQIQKQTEMRRQWM